ncbi:carbon-nitrogen hydrolase family protein [uncultured Chryseobacterium sp.]|uniref:carbon-nitrogen hydrolase family protein n=1 Tax=uncultured Chryseobacterium sp. TaxID=259322 RepID=UPI00258681AD|nr:carbon-nitrogen hydrolase family protein [uncultured Chryseobacterium sp.]
MKIAVAQTKPLKGKILSNIEKHEILITEAIQKNVEVIIFPELSITGYERELARQLSIDYNDPLLDNFQITADDHNIIIIVGMPVKSGNSLLISNIIFQPNKARSIYSKRHLFPTETDIFSKGNTSCQLEIAQNKISLAICYDLSDPIHSLEAYQHGSNIYTASVLNSIGGIDHDLLTLSAIAEKYNMHVLMANFIGESGGYECAGKSSAWDCNGNLIGQLNHENEGILILNTENNQTDIVYIH